MNRKKIIEQIGRLSEKYSATGQDLYSYLDGLLYSDYLGYWDYIHLDTLLSLQTPKTDFPDEKIFIIYHQITELYFQLCLLELEQINKNGKNILETGEDLGWQKKITLDLFIGKLERINRYFDNLILSFDIMIQGMKKEEFLKFRMALLPSSGFQSVQYRMIEIRSTDLSNLTVRKNGSNSTINSLYKELYWRTESNRLANNTKTYTLKQFERKYNKRLLKLANKMNKANIWQKYHSLPNTQKKNKKLIKLLKQYDANININWKLAHYKSAAKYLKKTKSTITATGGTNWETYLPPKFQRVIFFPELWTKEEQKNWGKSWVESIKT